MQRKTIIVTGASRGIGFAAAEYLINASHNVVLVARTADPLEKLKSKSPKQVSTCVGDIADFAIAAKAVEIANQDFGQLDGLILNHGILDPATRVANSDPEEWRKCFDIKAALPGLRKSNGRVIFTSSGASTKAYSTWGAYGASKAAMNHLNLTLAAEEPSLTCMSIRPGVVDTQMQRDVRDIHSSSMDEKDNMKFKSLHEEGKLVRPEQSGHVIAKLAISAPKSLSGQFLE
ncbi:MAG: hypothetical protein Q9222_005077 [Ikaeria aurantiellina]